MISSQILNQLSVKLQTSAVNIHREYLQHLFLSSFYQQKDTGEICFKGGTALRLIFRSPRFSEDLDFNVKRIDSGLLENSIQNSLYQIGQIGLSPELIEAKPTTGGYLAQINCPIGSLPISLLLQFSARHPHLSSELITVENDFIPTYSLSLMETHSLVSEKIQALLTRHKPRDYYDLYYLLRANLLTPLDKQLLTKVQTLLKQTSLDFSSELRQFLPESHWPIIKDFKTTLVRELSRFTG